jgi:hypothetical protein
MARFASGSATGNYAVADAVGTADDPSHVNLRAVATPAQAAEVTWTMTCEEEDGGVGQKSGQAKQQLPLVERLPLPAPSTSCIVSVVVQLSRGGTLLLGLYNGSAPSVGPSTGSSLPSPVGQPEQTYAERGGFGSYLVRPSLYSFSVDGDLEGLHLSWAHWGASYSIGRGGLYERVGFPTAETKTVPGAIKLYDRVSCDGAYYYTAAAFYPYSRLLFPARPQRLYTPCDGG